MYEEPGGDDVMALLENIQRQIGFLEKKIDLLLGKSQPRSFGSFDRPGYSRHRPDRDRGGFHGKKDSSGGERRYGGEPQRFDRDRGQRSGYGTDRPQRSRGFDKSPGGEKGGFHKKREPFYSKVKGGRGAGIGRQG